MATKEEYFARAHVEAVEVDGVKHYFRVFKGAQRAAWTKYVREGLKTDPDIDDWVFFSNLLVLTLCDEQGTLLFDDPKEMAQNIDQNTLERLYEQARRINGLVLVEVKKN